MNLIIYVYQFRDVYFGRHLARSDNTIFLADYINFYNTIHALLISIKQFNLVQLHFYSLMMTLNCKILTVIKGNNSESPITILSSDCKCNWSKFAFIHIMQLTQMCADVGLY